MGSRDAFRGPGLEQVSRATFHYYDRHFDAPAVKLLPTEYCLGTGNLVLTTVLGSCVAACLYDLDAGIGGMNHFMLPGPGDGPPDVGAVPDTRYGTHAMHLLVEQLLKAGARRERLAAKVFGGGAVISGMTQLNVGERNCAFIRTHLATAKIPLVAEDLGGTLARRICFFPSSGRVALRRLKREEELMQVRQDEQHVIGLLALMAQRSPEALR